MKVFVVIIALAACVFAEESAEDAAFYKIIDECQKEANLDDDKFTATIGKFNYPNEEPVGKFLACLGQKTGAYNPATGTHNPDVIAKLFKTKGIPEEETKQAVTDCDTKFPKGDKPDHVAAVDFQNCLMSSSVGEKMKKTPE